MEYRTNKKHDIIETLLSVLETPGCRESELSPMQAGPAIKEFMDQMPGGILYLPRRRRRTVHLCKQSRAPDL